MVGTRLLVVTRTPHEETPTPARSRVWRCQFLGVSKLERPLDARCSAMLHNTD